jgi:hypothetical protein
MRSAETLVFERPLWMSDADWLSLVASLRAVASAEEQRIDRERCEAARRPRPVEAERAPLSI